MQMKQPGGLHKSHGHFPPGEAHSSGLCSHKHFKYMVLGDRPLYHRQAGIGREVAAAVTKDQVIGDYTKATLVLR